MKIRIWQIVSLALLLAAVSSLIPVRAATGEGSLQLIIQDYGSVRGQLKDAIIHPDRSVVMTMVVNDQLQTPMGSFPVTAGASWNGAQEGSNVSGSINDVLGKIQICVIFSCNDAKFTGQGQWIGTVSASHANGTFQGTIAFANSPVPQIPVNQPLPVSGFWNADFLLPVPEFESEQMVHIMAFAAVFTLISLRRKRNFHQNGRHVVPATSVICRRQ
jgi:hypothetical protein